MMKKELNFKNEGIGCSDVSEVYDENILLKLENSELTDILIEWGDILYVMNGDLKKQKKDNDNLNRKIEELLSEIESLNHKNENLLDENEKLSNVNLRLNDEIGKILSSNSWKLTKPLRFIRNFLK